MPPVARAWCVPHSVETPQKPFARPCLAAAGRGCRSLLICLAPATLTGGVSRSWTLSRLILLNKPYGVICQFSGDGTRPTLADHVAVPGVYPAGRLDTDSEGLLLLTDDGALQHRIADPKHKLPKTYLVQVEGKPDHAALSRLRAGVNLGDFKTQPCAARPVPEPDWLWPRDPPVRFRKSVQTTWLEIVLREGKNRQLRRMTAAVGFPTLRLVRTTIGAFRLEGLALGAWREETIPAALRGSTRPDGVRRAGDRGGRMPSRTKPRERGK